MEFLVYKTFAGSAYVVADSLEEAIETADSMTALDMDITEVDSIVEEA